jgi:hypothetical protein
VKNRQKKVQYVKSEGKVVRARSEIARCVLASLLRRDDVAGSCYDWIRDVNDVFLKEDLSSRQGNNDTRSKYPRAYGGCLATVRRRRTRLPAKSHGEREVRFDPWMSEWGNPSGVMSTYPKGSQPRELKHLSTWRKRKQT